MATDAIDKLGVGKERRSKLPGTEPPGRRRDKCWKGRSNWTAGAGTTPAEDAGMPWTLENAGPWQPGPGRCRQRVHHEAATTRQRRPP